MNIMPHHSRTSKSFIEHHLNEKLWPENFRNFEKKLTNGQNILKSDRKQIDSRMMWVLLYLFRVPSEFLMKFTLAPLYLN